MTFPAEPFAHRTLEDTLDEFVEEWLEDYSEEEVIAALLAKTDEMQATPAIADEETKEVDDATDS